MRDLEGVLKSYDMGGASVSLLHDWANTTYRVECQRGSYLLRVHRNGGIGALQIESELTYLRWLHDEVPFALQHPLANRHGEWTTPWGDHFVSLLSWLPGEVWTADELTGHNVRSIGAMIGHLHVAARRFAIPPLWSRSRLDSAHLLIEVLGVGEEGWRAATAHQKQLLHETYTLAMVAEVEAGQSAAAFGMVHGDLHFGNIVRGVSGESSPIDFDDMGTGFFVYDLAVGAAKMVRLNNFEFLRDALLEGYASTAPTRDIGLHLLPVWMAMRTASIAVWLLGASATRPVIRETAASWIDPMFQKLENQLRQI